MVGVFGIVQHCLAACEKARKTGIFKHSTFLSLSASLYLCLSDSNAVCSNIGFVSFRHFAPPLFVIYMEYVKSHIRPKMRTCLHKLKTTQQVLQIGNNTNIFLEKSPNFIVL